MNKLVIFMIMVFSFCNSSRTSIHLASSRTITSRKTHRTIRLGIIGVQEKQAVFELLEAEITIHDREEEFTIVCFTVSVKYAAFFPESP